MTVTRRARRGGAAAVEAALVLPVMLFILLAILVGGHGMLRYQLVACQAREAARWAAVRGGDYQTDTGDPSPTRQEVLGRVVVPLAVGMDPAALALDMAWVDKATGTAQPWDAAPKAVRSITPGGEYVSNTVRVTVSYRWTPGVLGDPVTISSACEVPMTH